MRYQTEEVLEIVKAIRNDAAGNKQATMTEMDLAGNMLESLAGHRDQLRAEVETLRKDAERYLWILNHYLEFHGERTLAAMALSSGGLDTAIDKAMAAKR